MQKRRGYKNKQEPRYKTTVLPSGKLDYMPLNRAAFRASMKRMNMEGRSKKLGARIGTENKKEFETLSISKQKKRKRKIVTSSRRFNRC